MTFEAATALAFAVVLDARVEVVPASFDVEHVRGGRAVCLFYGGPPYRVACCMDEAEGLPDQGKLFLAFHEACHAVATPNTVDPGKIEAHRKRELQIEDEVDRCAERWLSPSGRSRWVRWPRGSPR